MGDRIKRALFILVRLYHNQAGNTLAIVAAAVLPLMGLIGGGVDMSRIYLTKSRLQQACDAGALAGRKTMGGGAWAANNNQALNAANGMFDANFRPGSYGSGTVMRSFSESAGKVTGTASVPLPMAIMRIFGINSKTIEVTCDAEMRLPNTDVMFVLDTTGSMASAISGDTETKIVGLRRAVRCFFEIVARLDTVAACDGGAPSGGTSSETQIRFGFVPYATNVNVGRLLPPEWFRDFSSYQSRERVVVYGRPVSYVDSDKTDWLWISWTQKTATTASDALCKSTYVDPTESSVATGTLSNGINESNGGLQGHGNWQATQPWQDTQRQFVSWTSNNKRCTYQIRSRSYTRTYTYQWSDTATSDTVAFNAWHYGLVSFDLRGLKMGNGWTAAGTVTLPIGGTTNNQLNSSYYNDRTITWNGCIEERQTARATTYIPLPEGAFDLDVNALPTTAPETQWAPALGQTIYRRGTTYYDSTRSTSDITTFSAFSANNSTECPVAATKLRQWASASDFDGYVDTLTPNGRTYHDIGLIWGARLISPTGLFASENATTARGGEIQRHVIFMTDGQADTDVDIYQAYGMAWYDRRQTDPNTVPTDGTSTSATLTQQVYARTAATCAAIKNMPNTTLWVVWFGTKNTTIENILTDCASKDRFFSAQSSAALQQTFRNIANQISQLRLTS
ncbi:pilus assembly protein TadG [Sphingobium indicum]|uniref:Pilus assembly protein TadG n=2 Tax=Sphingobium indicum TaxID=332055 RepID=A0A1L5BN95_SPHIB|nr:Tad domain-containing protein [Sphingobium indicum]APL94333.1 pilus assembly protein TadG [Sphingobium indicum B90A]KEY98222.1 pilus assembly protein TadG [Sphingomonas sp. BHC-A]NYI24411.1 Flp pilus assembly protein TadG [Sphingobium indicum]RYM04072.1 pilus assembly protein TadG [Sphingobium indicum]